MQNCLGKARTVLCVVVLLSMTGCAIHQQFFPRSLVEEAQEQVKYARDKFEEINEPDFQKKYPKDFKKAEEKLHQAEQDLEKLQEMYTSKIPQGKGHLERLHASVGENAKKSRAASQKILKSYYLDTVVPMLEAIEAELQTVDDTDTDYPLKDMKPLLLKMSKKVEEVKGGEKVLTLTEVINDIDALIQANTVVQLDVQKTVKTDDIRFNIGEYELSEKAERILKKVLGRIIAALEEMMKQQPGGTIIIQLKTVGHTDEADFRSESEIIPALTKDEERKIPTDKVKRRWFLNQRLSKFRANTVSEYLKRGILQREPTIKIQQEIVAKGEEIPPGVASPFPTNDSRRRICKIYCYISVE